ncbi:MAG: biotin/lipoyl-containing protein [SAR202 cluster bacterium]|jgi:sugar O-acyltransferase (sialic acid O-acetyltransferase NeuD family)|nr:biotin/lipoyl-containing protein [SAR202 cluster bacterium]
MPHNVIVPKLGTNMTEATVVRWMKSEGDPVSAGEPIVEVETDKALFEVESEFQGVLLRQLAGLDENVPVALPIAVIGAEGEDITAHLKEIEEARGALDSDERHAAQSHANWYADRSPAAIEADTSEQTRVRATPAARNLARKLGVHLEKVAQTVGSNRTIDKEDVERAAQTIPLAVFGAGLGAAQVLDVVRFSDEYRVVALVDDDESLWGASIRGCPVFGMDDLARSVDSGEVRALAVSIHSNARKPVYERLKQRFPELPFPALVHPNAYLGYGVVVGDGSLVEPGSTIGTESVLGEGVIIDTGVTVSHHCNIGRFCHLAPGCVISGNVRIDDNTVIMAGAVVNNTSTIGKNVVVTPGSVVTYDRVEDSVIMHGNPARETGKSRRT